MICHNCGSGYSDDLAVCPACATPAPRRNPWLDAFPTTDTGSVPLPSNPWADYESTQAAAGQAVEPGVSAAGLGSESGHFDMSSLFRDDQPVGSNQPGRQPEAWSPGGSTSPVDSSSSFDASLPGGSPPPRDAYPPIETPSAMSPPPSVATPFSPPTPVEPSAGDYIPHPVTPPSPVEPPSPVTPPYQATSSQSPSPSTPPIAASSWAVGVPHASDLSPDAVPPTDPSSPAVAAADAPAPPSSWAMTPSDASGQAWQTLTGSLTSGVSEIDETMKRLLGYPADGQIPAPAVSPATQPPGQTSPVRPDPMPPAWPDPTPPAKPDPTPPAWPDPTPPAKPDPTPPAIPEGTQGQHSKICLYFQGVAQKST